MRFMSELPVSPRSARVRLEQARALAAQLAVVDGLLNQLEIDAKPLGSIRNETRVIIEKLESAALGRIEPRVRFKAIPRPDEMRSPECYLFLDECGTHIGLDEKFPVFCLSGVIVSKADYEAFDVTWKAWKTRHLGGPEVVAHEPDARHFNRQFRRDTANQRAELERSLAERLQELDFTCIAAVIDMKAFHADHPTGAVDEFLPTACYLMCIDFIMERFVHFLHYKGDDARGLVVAESRGALEDAKVHAEFIRLHIEGTQFLSAYQFRHQLRPHIEFLRKTRNNSGLQVADLSARPFAEKVIDPTADVARWPAFKQKLYDGMKAAPHSYGLKVFPLKESNDPFHEFREQAKGDVSDIPFAPTSLG